MKDKIKYYPICDYCANGDGKECHTPGCTFCFCDVPKNITPEFGLDLKSLLEGRRI